MAEGINFEQEALPANVALFFLERDVKAGCEQQKQQRLIYSRNAKKGLGR